MIFCSIFLVDSTHDSYDAAQYLKLLGGAFKLKGATMVEFEGA